MTDSHSALSVELRPVTAASLRAFKNLCTSVLPVRVEDRVYAEMAVAPPELVQLGEFCPFLSGFAAAVRFDGAFGCRSLRGCDAGGRHCCQAPNQRGR